MCIQGMWTRLNGWRTLKSFSSTFTTATIEYKIQEQFNRKTKDLVAKTCLHTSSLQIYKDS